MRSNFFAAVKIHLKELSKIPRVKAQGEHRAAGTVKITAGWVAPRGGICDLHGILPCNAVSMERYRDMTSRKGASKMMPSGGIGNQSLERGTSNPPSHPDRHGSIKEGKPYGTPRCLVILARVRREGKQRGEASHVESSRVKSSRPMLKKPNPQVIMSCALETR